MTTEQRNQWRGIESSPIKLTPVRPHSSQVSTTYDEQLEDESLYPTRPSSSVKRYQTNNIPLQQQNSIMHPGQQQIRQLNQYDNVNVYVRRRSAQTPRPQQVPRPPLQPEPDQDDELEIEPLRRTRQRSRFNWLVYIGLGMVSMLILWIVGAIALNWWQGYQDDLRYGRPRTYQCDARIGHNDVGTSSHFIALNLNHRVEVIEFPGGDATKAKVYLGPMLTGQNSDLDIVTVSFKDVNGDGKPDMIVSVVNAKYPYINDNGAFRPPHGDEHISM